jgi:hypothetical protein
MESLGPLFATAQKAATENSTYLYKVNKANTKWEFAEAPSLKTHWNKLFPYQLVILKKVGKDWVIASDPNSVSRDNTVPPSFTLPIPPQTLSIDMQFAAQVEASQGGVVEQYNGAAFYDIALSGTTGVLPLRGTVETPSAFSANTFTGGVLLGTVNAVSTAVQSAATIGNIPFPNVISEEEFQSTIASSKGYGTGYFQFLQLKRFLEWYDTAKKQKTNQNLALGFAVWKEREVYVCTPMKFTVNRSAEKALHYQYSIVLRAWKRVVPTSGAVGSLSDHKFVGQDPSLYGRLIGALDQSRRTLENTRKILQAVRADINQVLFGTLRQITLFAKGVAGVGYAAADFGSGLAKDFRSPLLEKLAFGREAIKNMTFNPELTPELWGLLIDLGNKNGKRKTGAGFSSKQYLKSFNTFNGVGDETRLFDAPDDFYDFWSNIRVDGLNLRPSTVAQIQDLRESVRGLRREDFERQRIDIAKILADFEASVGLSDPTYESIYGAARAQLKDEPSDTDWEVMAALNQVIEVLDTMAASSTINQTDNTSSINYIAGLARGAGIAFTTPRSKFLVPVPYGMTLEQISNMYFGTPERWIEIAALNGLKTPYVDEVGVTEALINNGYASQIAVSGTTPYYVGQLIWISSSTVRRIRRRITRLDTIDDGVLLSVDGAADMDQFLVNDAAQIQSFAPETTNSLQFLFLPSDTEVETDWQTKSIPGVDTYDPMFRVGGADLLLDSHGDLVIAPDGSTRLAVGLTNLLQRLRIAVGTPQGSLLGHPEFGFGVVSGTSTAEVDASQLLAAAKSFVSNEEGFSGISYASVTKSGNGLTLNMQVGIAGTAKEIPLSVNLR